MSQKFEFTSKYFRQKRIDAGMTQSELATALGFSSAQIVSNWERGVCAPPMASLRPMIKILKLDPEEVTDVITEENKRVLSELLTPRRASKSKRA
ncbi:MAG: helix-turn-helix transcriptional regulator [Bdellovibrionota bacterium]